MNIRPSGDIGPAPQSRHSPCVGVCTLDPAIGWCLGCGRTGDEIASWIGLDDAGRLAIWNELPARLDRLAVRARLLPWTRDELKRWIVSTLTDRKGTWVTGVPGAVAEFPVRPERPIEIEVNDAAIEARATDAHLRLALHDKLRGFAFAGAGPIVLGLPRNRATLPNVQGFTSLGVDRDAVDSRHRTHELFDLGRPEGGDDGWVEVVERPAEAFALSQDGEPRQADLESFQAELLEDTPVIADRQTPFVVVVVVVFGCGISP